MAEIAGGIKGAESVTRNTVAELPSVPSAMLPEHVVRGPRSFGRRTRHPAVPARDAAAFLAMDTCRRREFVDLRLGEAIEGGFDWVYVYPLDPAIWYAERPGKPYPLARMLVLFPGFAPAAASLRGMPVALADGTVARGGERRVTALLSRPRLLEGKS